MLCGTVAKVGGKDLGTALTVDVPFETVRLGAGPGPVLGAIILPPNAVRESVSFAVVQGVQDLQLSILSPKLTSKTSIMFSQEWITDIAALSPADITSYNRTEGNLKLPDDRIIGVQFKGQSAELASAIRFTLRAQIYTRGAGGEFRAYGGNYNGEWFSQKLLEHIKQQLSKIVP
jgi:hypothetical protein